jgi:hypothetical protein
MSGLPPKGGLKSDIVRCPSSAIISRSPDAPMLIVSFSILHADIARR